MERSGGEDRKLSEVKAVLQRLQRISADQHADTRDAPAAPLQASRGRRPALIASLGLASAVVLAIGALTLTDLNRLVQPTLGRVFRQPAGERDNGKTDSAAVKDASPAPSPALPPALQRPALDFALGELAAGRVQAARKQLLGLVSQDAAEVAWALARSYDPNFLATIPEADAGPDIPEATRWYRAWHAAAVKHGLVTHNVPLERIIGSMR